MQTLLRKEWATNYCVVYTVSRQSKAITRRCY